MTPGRERIICFRHDLPPPRRAGDAESVVVLDPAIMPPPGTIAFRDLVGPALAAEDFDERALSLLETWVEASELIPRMSAGGVSWWYRNALWTWTRVHESLVWLAALERLGAASADRIVITPGEPVLADMARLVAGPARVAVGAAGGSDVGRPSGPRRIARSVLWRLGLHERQRAAARQQQARARAAAGEGAYREAVLGAARRWADEHAAGRRGRLVVLTIPRAHQVVGSGGPRRDHLLDGVVDLLRGTPLDPIVVEIGDPSADAAAPVALRPVDWALLEQWADGGDTARARVEREALEVALAAAPAVPLPAGQVDLGPYLRQAMARGTASVEARLVTSARAERLLRAVGASGLLLTDESSRTEWVLAARRAGIPVFAVQHGLIYPGHVQYRHARSPLLALAHRTFVFGDYERRTLVEHGGYRPAEVVVSGSPRPVEDPASPAARDASRAEVRAELGVAPGHRMVVVSTTHGRLHQQVYLPNLFGRLLGERLPDVHLVFKQHPIEPLGGWYEDAVRNLAARGGFTPPPMTTVRDVNLVRLLRAADAHLGLFSTVLTDAVLAGTPNLLAVTQAHRDLLGYVDAGVARPVASPAELRAAIDTLAPPALADREAFVADHFRAGDASSVIARTILDEVEAPRP